VILSKYGLAVDTLVPKAVQKRGKWLDDHEFKYMEMLPQIIEKKDQDPSRTSSMVISTDFKEDALTMLPVSYYIVCTQPLGP
jgi:hypothetical protein